MITKSSVKVQKSFSVEFILNEPELNNLCLLLAHGCSSVFNDEDLNGVINDDSKIFMRSIRDYVINLRDNVDRHCYVD